MLIPRRTGVSRRVTRRGSRTVLARARRSGLARVLASGRSRAGGPATRPRRESPGLQRALERRTAVSGGVEGQGVPVRGRPSCRRPGHGCRAVGSGPEPRLAGTARPVRGPGPSARRGRSAGEGSNAARLTGTGRRGREGREPVLHVGVTVMEPTVRAPAARIVWPRPPRCSSHSARPSPARGSGDTHRPRPCV